LASERLAEAERTRQALADQLAAAIERHDRVQDLVRSSPDCEVPLAVFVNGRTWLSAARAEIARLRERLARAEEVCQQRRGDLLAASRRKKTLQRLLERRQSEQQRQQSLAEQRELDELSATRGSAGPLVLTLNTRSFTAQR